MNDTMLNSSRLIVGLGKQNPITGYKRLMISNLAAEIEKGDLEKVFSEFGTVMDVRIGVNENTGGLNNIGFVEYLDVDSAEDALVKMNKATLGNSVISIAKVKNQYPVSHLSRESKTLLINHLHSTIEEQHLLELFRNHGTVQSARIPVDNLETKRSFAFVAFATLNDSKNAMERMQGKLVNGKAISIGYSVYA